MNTYLLTDGTEIILSKEQLAIISYSVSIEDAIRISKLKEE